MKADLLNLALMLSSSVCLSFFAVDGPQQPAVCKKLPRQTDIQSTEHPEVHCLQ